ncbi:MAG TPA: DUF881 domain-containing protein [Coriobacteriia bacterium]
MNRPAFDSRKAIESLRDDSRRAMRVIRSESLRAVRASEEAVGRGFDEARLRASLAISLVLVGFLLVAQWRGVHTTSASLEGQSDQSLAVIIGEVSAENNAMRDEILGLETRLLKADRDEQGRTDVLNQAAREIDNLNVAGGFEAARGPGVVLTVRDPAGTLQPRDLVVIEQELRAAGAEAVAVNGVRLQASTGFASRRGRLTAGGTELTGPLRFLAIGDAGNLRQALELPGGLKTTLTAFPEVGVSIQPSDELEVPAGPAARFLHGRPARS